MAWQVIHFTKTKHEMTTSLPGLTADRLTADRLTADRLTADRLTADRPDADRPDAMADFVSTSQ